MISYQWDTKPKMLLVRDRLRKAGLNVWMDIDNLSERAHQKYENLTSGVCKIYSPTGGSVLEGMAQAVEQASVIVVGLTQKYKDSPSCRTGFARFYALLNS